MSKPNLNLLTKWTWKTEATKMQAAFDELYGGGLASDASQFVYGANISRFLKKLKDWHSQRIGANCPRIVMIGDSLTNGSWPAQFATYLNTNFNLTTANFQKYNYGGQGIDQMYPQIVDALISPNWDLIIFGEYEGSYGDDKYLRQIETLIQLIRERTTSDIAVFTWGMYRADIEAILAGSSISDRTIFKVLNWYRDIAKIYNCELIDTNWAIIQTCLNGADLDAIWADGTHFTTTGYQIFYDETIKHFKTPTWVENTNITYPLSNKEFLKYYAEQMRFKSLAKGDIIFGNEANWSDVNSYVTTSQANETVILDAKDIIGFELKYIAATANISLHVSTDNGSTWVAPSAIRFNGLPLSFCTPACVSGFPLLAKHVTVKNNILANGTLESGEYYMECTGIDGSDYTVALKNPAGTTLGTFLLYQQALETTDFIIPLKHNGENNYDTTTPPIVGSKAYFKVKSNWIDTVDTSTGNTAKVFGFARADYKIKITVNSGSPKLLGLNLLK